MIDSEATRVEEETLDPDDWSEMRALGHRMVDDMFTYLESVENVTSGSQCQTKCRQHSRPLFHQGSKPQPRFTRSFSKIFSPILSATSPSILGVGNGQQYTGRDAADMLASGINPNVGGGDHVANRVELQVINWCKEMLGFPPEASGLLVSGGSMANLLGLAVARHAKSGFDVRQQGVGASPKPMTMYVSTEMHSSLQRAVEVLGPRQLVASPHPD